jgi:6-phosphogluconate dehydrogenase
MYNFAMIGIGVMGRNFLLNMADNGFKVIGFNKSKEKTDALEAAATPGTTVKGVNSLQEIVNLLEVPRKIMLLVPAGKPVDEVIESLIPLVSKGDIIIDGGNSHYTDTLRRVAYLKEKNIHFVGMGVSGGEEGARKGPSIMPGGDKEAYPHIQPMLEAVSAKVNGEPCVAYLGNGAAGQFVKMVHNGIEYSIMQLISEVYDLLHRGLGLTNDELHQVFKQWNEGELQSFLIEITRDIFLQKDPETGDRLVDKILDKAGSKGTGKWTSQDAMNLGVPIPSIDVSVSMRNLSAYKKDRVAAAELYKTTVKPITAKKDAFITQAHDALYFSIMISYAQGLALLSKASTEFNMQIPIHDAVKIWRGGCIIRSTMLEIYYSAYKKNPSLTNILLDKSIVKLIKKKERNLRAVVKSAVQSKVPAAGLMSALNYFDAFTTATLPINLIQAQRDFFGAHTYERIDKEGIFHTEWNQ